MVAGRLRSIDIGRTCEAAVAARADACALMVCVCACVPVGVWLRTVVCNYLWMRGFWRGDIVVAIVACVVAAFAVCAASVLVDAVCGFVAVRACLRLLIIATVVSVCRCLC